MDETKNVNDMSTSGSETEQRENYRILHIFKTAGASISPATNCLKTVFSTAFSAIVRCMHWAINAAGISNSLRVA